MRSGTLSKIKNMAEKAQLTLEIEELRNQQGTVYVALFNSSEGFPNDGGKAVKADSYPITAVPLSITIDDIPFGSYAITVFHDENNDGKLNKGIFGVPKEGFGFSDNPMVLTGPPSFEKASFEFAPEKKRITITMKYLSL